MISFCYYAILSNILLRVTASECVDKVNNRFVVASLEENLPVRIENLVVDAYDDDMKPSCARDEPNIALPGYLNLIKGQVTVPYKFDLTNNSFVKLSATSEDGTRYCVDGKSDKWFLPNDYCVINLCELIGNDMCDLLGQPGTHTLQDLIDKLNFNPKLKLPAPPCLLGLVCVTDFFGGRYHIEFDMEYKNKTVLRWKVPVDRRFLQIIDSEDDDKDDD